MKFIILIVLVFACFYSTNAVCGAGSCGDCSDYTTCVAVNACAWDLTANSNAGGCATPLTTILGYN